MTGEFQLHGTTDYNEQRWTLMSNLEGFGIGDDGKLYYDSAESHFLTIGFGFNLSITAIQTQVMSALGLDARDDANDTEKGYVQQIKNALNGATTGGAYGHADSLQSQLDGIMQNRKSFYDSLPPDSPIPKPSILKTTFAFVNDQGVPDKSLARPVFEFIAETDFNGEPSYERRVDDWLTDHGIGLDLSADSSKEHLALFSMAYHGSLNASTRLATALKDATDHPENSVVDRVKAWIEIRYLTTNQSASDAHGQAKRHYAEADMFGLYRANDINTDDAQKVYETLQNYRRTIDGGMAVFSQYDSTFNPDRVNANAIPGIDAETLSGELIAARNLLGIIANTGNSEIDTLYYTTVFNPLNIHIGDSSNIFGETLSVDLLEAGKIIGGGGGDTIYGNAGIDHLEGAVGNDTLYGNDGNDLMHGDFLNYADNPFTPTQYASAAMWGNDTLDGGIGQDQIVGDGGNDVINGGDGDDFLFGDWGDGGEDVINADMGMDTIYGDAGNDLISGDGNDDELHGGDGNDQLVGDYGNNFIAGEIIYNEGADTLYGEIGDDSIRGNGGGGNVFFVGAHRDAPNVVYKGSSIASVYYPPRPLAGEGSCVSNG